MNKPHIWKIKESPWWCCDGAAGPSPKAAYYAWMSLFNQATVVQPMVEPDMILPPRAMGIPPRVGSFED